MAAKSIHCEPDSRAKSSFEETITYDDIIPCQKDIESVEDYALHNSTGRTTRFRDVFTGPTSPRRVLVIFVGHFLNPDSQEYIRTLSQTIAYSTLILLPVSTTIIVVGCGPANPLPLFRAETACRFPVFADPSGELYAKLGMIRSRNLGPRPDYQRYSVPANILRRAVQVLRLLKKGKPVSGVKYQVGGEFLFEPLTIDTPSPSTSSADANSPRPESNFHVPRTPRTPAVGEEKIISWCYRMRHARDHVELPELKEVLGVQGPGGPGMHPKRWAKALTERKGVGSSWMQDMARWHTGSYLDRSTSDE